MRESVMYQYIKAEGASEMILRQLKRKIGTISSDLQQAILQLPLEVLENLGEALLDFSTEAELQAWLENNKSSSNEF